MKVRFSPNPGWLSNNLRTVQLTASNITYCRRGQGENKEAKINSGSDTKMKTRV